METKILCVKKTNNKTYGTNKQTIAPVTYAKAEWRKKPSPAVRSSSISSSTERNGSRELPETGNDGDIQENQENQEYQEEGTDDDPLGHSFDHSGDQRQTPSKLKSKQNQTKQSGTGIRFESDSQWYLSWLQQSKSRSYLSILVLRSTEI